MNIVPRNAPVTLENAAKLLPLIEEQSGHKAAFVETPKGWTYFIDGIPSGLRCIGEHGRAMAERSACRLLLGRNGDVKAFLADQLSALKGKADRLVAKVPEQLRAATLARVRKRLGIPD